MPIRTRRPPSRVGEGTIDWKKVIGTAHANGVKHYFYEQEEPFTRPILDSAKISARLPDQADRLTSYGARVKTIKGPAVFLAQFAGGGPHLQNLNDMAKWAKECGFIGVQLPSWDGRVMDLAEGRREQDVLR